jgi:integrase
VRRYGSGSLSRHPRGGWQAQYVHAGKRHTVYARTKLEAQGKLKELIERLAAPTPDPISPETLKDACSLWLDAQSASLRPYTADTYRVLLRRGAEALGADRAVATISSDDVQRYAARLRTEGRAPNTIRNHLRPLLAAIAARTGHDLHVRVPQPKTTTSVLSKADLQRLRAVLAGHWLEGPALLAAGCGLRAGEVTALQWRDVDLLRRQLYVHRPIPSGKERRYSATEAKTASGARLVHLPPALVTLLAQRPVPAPEALVFARADGSPLRANLFPRALRRLCRQAGVAEVTFHQLRHSNATALLEAGVNPLQVQRHLGHADVRTTLGIYAHLTHRMEEHAHRQIDDLLTDLQ